MIPLWRAGSKELDEAGANSNVPRLEGSAMTGDAEAVAAALAFYRWPFLDVPPRY